MLYIVKMAAIEVKGLSAIVGVDVAPSPWVDVTQELVDAFARATGDDQWIHVDAERAADGPYGSTVAHGLFTLAMIPRLWRQTVRIAGARLAINYGLDNVRFPAPLRIPSRIRALFKVTEVASRSDATKSVVAVRVEGEGAEKPVCVADMLLLHYR